jgi:hypothetical protein
MKTAVSTLLITNLICIASPGDAEIVRFDREVFNTVYSHTSCSYDNNQSLELIPIETIGSQMVMNLLAQTTNIFTPEEFRLYFSDILQGAGYYIQQLPIDPEDSNLEWPNGPDFINAADFLGWTKQFYTYYTSRIRREKSANYNLQSMADLISILDSSKIPGPTCDAEANPGEIAYSLSVAMFNKMIEDEKKAWENFLKSVGWL